MADESVHELLFADGGFSFDDIIKTHACGGSAAVSGYLQCRRRMIIREMNSDPLDDPRGQGYLDVINAFDVALSLFEQLLLEGLSDAVEQDDEVSKA